MSSSIASVAKLSEEHAAVLTAALTSDQLQLILMPTEQCNFRCVYCYENFSIGRMAPWLIDALKTLIAARAPELKSLSLAWFGGEPLVARDIVMDLSKFSNQLADSHEIAFGGSVTTNGWFLTPEIVEELDSYGIREYQVSLDGPEEIHDASRPTVKGAGTFARIWQNLLSLKRTSVPFLIKLRIHYRPSTLEAVLALGRTVLAELAGDDSRFEMNFKAVGHYGGPNDDQVDVFGDTPEDRAAVQRLAELFTSAGVRPSFGAGSSNRPLLERICYAARANSFVIRADGRVGKCTVALSDERNTIGRITADGRIAIDAPKLMPWLAGLETLDWNALGCPYSQLLKQPVPKAA
jgi:uncharacterized protein